MSRKTPAELAADAARKRERRRRLKAEGLCGTCGQVPPMQGFAECETCLEANATRGLKSYHESDGLQKLRKQEARYRKNGRCRCGRPRAKARRKFSNPDRALLAKCEECSARSLKENRPAAIPTEKKETRL